MNDRPAEEYRSGFVAVAGRPNVGKSTLVNRILGTDLSIVTRKAQTTRHRITAIHSMDRAQIILLDTPGIHEASTPLNRTMVEAAVKTLEDADTILFMATPKQKMPDEDRRIIELLKAARVKSVCCINKIDLIKPPNLLPLIEMYSQMHSFEAIVPISALKGSGVDELVEVLTASLPVGPPLYPVDDISDLPTRFFVSEIIREQVMKCTGEEVPYKTTVMVESFKERPGHVLIQADIHTERESHKKILVGKGGQMVKKIGTAARSKIQDFLQSKVRLELFVKVTPKWSRDPRKLKEFGYQ
jgi:GTPase